MTSVTTTCRDLAELLPAAQTACRLLFQECYKAGIKNIFITETYRSQARQHYLYAQGRTRPGKIVTWTLKSNHKSRLAWDIAVVLHNHCMISHNVLEKYYTFVGFLTTVDRILSYWYIILRNYVFITE
ncbi:hypothetical protein LSPH24S_04197 [Lysinibacillus sphaericus]